MTHRHRAGADEALAAGPEFHPFDGTPDRIRAIEYPHGLALRRGFLEHVTQCGHECIYAAANILQINEQDVEGIHHGRSRAPHGAVQAEHRYLVHRVGEVGGLDHVVLLVAPQAVLRPERGREPEAAHRAQGVQGMNQVARHRGGVSQQRHASSAQRLAELGLLDQAVNSELHGESRERRRRDDGNRVWRRRGAAPSTTACRPALRAPRRERSATGPRSAGS